MDGKIDKEMDRFIAGQKRGLLIHLLGQKNINSKRYQLKDQY